MVYKFYTKLAVKSKIEADVAWADPALLTTTSFLHRGIQGRRLAHRRGGSESASHWNVLSPPQRPGVLEPGHRSLPHPGGWRQVRFCRSRGADII